MCRGNDDALAGEPSEVWAETGVAAGAWLSVIAERSACDHSQIAYCIA